MKHPDAKGDAIYTRESGFGSLPMHGGSPEWAEGRTKCAENYEQSDYNDQKFQISTAVGNVCFKFFL